MQLARKISFAMGYEFTQDYIIDYLIRIFTTYPKLAKILASDPTLTLEEAIEIAEKLEKHFDMSASNAVREYVEQGSSNGETLLILLFIYFLNELEKVERKNIQIYMTKRLDFESLLNPFDPNRK